MGYFLSQHFRVRNELANQILINIYNDKNFNNWNVIQRKPTIWTHLFYLTQQNIRLRYASDATKSQSNSSTRFIWNGQCSSEMVRTSLFFHITYNNPRHGSIIDLLLPPCVYPPRYLSVYLLLPLPQRDPTYKLNCPRRFHLSHILKVVFSPKTNLN